MDRRAFIAGLAAAVTTVSYFDMGTAWRKNEAGVYVETDPWAVEGEALFIESDKTVILHPRDYEAVLKEHYNDRTVASLTYGSQDLFKWLR